MSDALQDLRLAYYCPACRIQGRPLLRIWASAPVSRKNRRAGRVKYMGMDRTMYSAPYECRHCCEPWWVWGRPDKKK